MDKKRPRFLFFDGGLVEYEQARVHVLSTAFKYGAIVFEGLRAYWNEKRRQLYVFRLDDHLHRLVASMRISRIVGSHDIDEYRDALLNLIRANEFQENLHIRVQVFVNADDGSIASSEPVSVSMAAMPMGHYFTRDGLHVNVSSWTRISDRSMPPRIKTVPNYQNSRLALLQARIDQYDDTILLTDRGTVSEGPGYTLFMVRRDQLVTPAVTESILESITRDSLLQLSRTRLGRRIVERQIDRTELYTADELFFCGSAAEVTPILSIDRHPVGDGRPGPRTRELRDMYLSYARGEDASDALGWLTPVYT